MFGLSIRELVKLADQHASAPSLHDRPVQCQRWIGGPVPTPKHESNPQQGVVSLLELRASTSDS